MDHSKIQPFRLHTLYDAYSWIGRIQIVDIRAHNQPISFAHDCHLESMRSGMRKDKEGRLLRRVCRYHQYEFRPQPQYPETDLHSGEHFQGIGFDPRFR